MKKNGDSFMTVDHLLLALLDEDSVSKLLSKAGLTRNKIDAVIKAVRGDSKVTSKQAETTYEAVRALIDSSSTSGQTESLMVSLQCIVWCGVVWCVARKVRA
jgi:ATP-dependent Clp protease ATP-binding subunit ClpA